MFKGIKQLKKFFSSKSKRDRHDSASDSKLLVNESVDSRDLLTPNPKPKKGVAQKARKLFIRVSRKNKYNWIPEIPSDQLTAAKGGPEQETGEISRNEMLWMKQEIEDLKEKMAEKDEELRQVEKSNRSLQKALDRTEKELAETETDNEMLCQLLKSNMYRTIARKERHHNRMQKAQETIDYQEMKLIVTKRQYHSEYKKRKHAEKMISVLEEEVRMLHIQNWKNEVNRAKASSASSSAKNGTPRSVSMTRNVNVFPIDVTNGCQEIPPMAGRMQQGPSTHAVSNRIYPLIDLD